jgi:hypothetical protein
MRPDEAQFIEVCRSFHVQRLYAVDCCCPGFPPVLDSDAVMPSSSDVFLLLAGASVGRCSCGWHLTAVSRRVPPTDVVGSIAGVA